MKKLTVALIIIFLICISLSFSACSDKVKEYTYYYFNEEVGEFVNDGNVSIALDKDGGKIVLKNNGRNSSIKAEYSEREVEIGNNEKYFFSDYYVVDQSSMLGSATINEEKEFVGEGELNGEKCTYSKGKIYDLRNIEIGKYEVRNNYITINYDGNAMELLIFTTAKDEDTKLKEVGFFKDFFTSTRVVANKIENTGFELDTKFVLNDTEGKIGLVFNQKDYLPTTVSFAVVDNGGFNFRIDNSGNYFYDNAEKETRDKIILSVTVDGLEKRFELAPLFFKFDKELMFLRYVDDSIDLNTKMFYICKGIDFKDISYSIEIIDGAGNIVLEDNVVTFKNSGYVVLQINAEFATEGKQFEIKDRVSINISGKQIEKK